MTPEAHTWECVKMPWQTAPKPKGENPIGFIYVCPWCRKVLNDGGAITAVDGT